MEKPTYESVNGDVPEYLKQMNIYCKILEEQRDMTIKSRSITISSKQGDSYIETRMHLDQHTIYISKNNRFIYNGDIPGFKALISKQQDPEMKAIYEDILDLGETVIETMAKA